ncbi:hypothetical protein [uncultured Aliiroseovarius sp.]|uniref:hypothetical protein n=1 Tax=uncultured Aliiroseovarius sp. TaxID=1658783 RepID=UPI002598A597|nr:hypothetical protein [uncultured Aliiroseovarius sp.]
MRVISLLPCLLFFWPMTLAADDIRIRSGEHANFSRLVVYVDPANTPHLTRTPNGYRLTLPNTANSFDTSTVFKFIPRTRISALASPASGILDIFVPCNCGAKTELLSGGRFVIDITDTPPSDDKAETEDPPTAAGTDQTISARVARRGLPIAIKTPNDKARPVVLETGDSHEAKTTTSALKTHPLKEGDLLQKLARAASQGLLTAPSIPASSERNPGPEKLLTGDEELPPGSDPTVSADAHIRVQTAIDRDTGRSPDQPAITKTGESCLSGESFAVANWGTEGTKTLDFAAYQAKLIGEFDKLQPQALTDLVRHLIYLTLGAEARSYLKLHGKGLNDFENMMLMAEILETGSSINFPRMTAQLTCDGPVALWAVLAHPRLPRGIPINTSSVISEFSLLPRHLRQHLGPLVMRKLLTIGDTETAIEINEITQRGVNITDTDHTLSEAKLSIATGETEMGHRALTDIVDADDENAVEAMLTLIDNLIETEAGIPQRTIELLASLAHEYQMSPEGRKLAIAEARSLIYAARFKDAQKKLDQLLGFPDAADKSHLTILNELGEQLTEAASDGVFLRYVIGQDRWNIASEETRTTVANRLLELGFSSAAKDLLVQNSAPPGRRARILIAKGALADGDAKVALGYLAGQTSPEARDLRDAAMIATGQLAPAIETSVSAVPDEDVTSGSVTPLASYHALIEQSRATRSQVDQALQAVPAM